MKKFTVTSFSQYIDIASRFGESYWFRGVKNCNYSLVPGAVRNSIPLKKELTLTIDFIREYQNYHTRINNSWELYSLMQHYGLPTRLLDWSKSPLVALFFSLQESPDIGPDGDYINRTVWMMKTGSLNQLNFLNKRIMPTVFNNGSKDAQKYLPSVLRDREYEKIGYAELPLALEMPYSNKRILAQKGCFTIHGSVTDGIDKILMENQLYNMIHKIIFNEETAIKMKEDLNKMHIYEDDIYQDLNSLTRRIIRKSNIIK